MDDTADILNLLQTGTLEIQGLLPWSSNYTFLMRVCGEHQQVEAVYKPRRGERPLWDFAQGTLCLRERAAFFLSQIIGWELVPPTVLRDGPHGLGSLQLFINHNPERHYFTFEGEPAYQQQLQKIVLLDFIMNNADRKSGHVLLAEGSNPPTDDRLWLIDHGICFHTDYKLRTVIWEFAGQPVPKALLADLTRLRDQLAIDANGIKTQLKELLSKAEIAALQKRLQQIVTVGVFLEPGPGRHYPWPPV